MSVSPVEFFLIHAGTSYNPAIETLEQGARRGAERLAAAELWAKDAGVTCEWHDDWEVGSHRDFYGDDSAYADAEPATCEWAELLDANDVTIATLSCIDDATDEYRRVVEAELALEAMPAEIQKSLPL